MKFRTSKNRRKPSENTTRIIKDPSNNGNVLRVRAFQPICVHGASGPRWAAGRGGVELVQQLLKAKARSELMANRGSAVKLGVSKGC